MSERKQAALLFRKRGCGDCDDVNVAKLQDRYDLVVHDLATASGLAGWCNAGGHGPLPQLHVLVPNGAANVYRGVDAIRILLFSQGH